MLQREKERLLATIEAVEVRAGASVEAQDPTR
jgi:hypothetical protein